MLSLVLKTSWFQGVSCPVDSGSSTQTMKRRHGGNPSQDVSSSSQPDVKDLKHQEKWRRILLLVVAVTVHNIPEGSDIWRSLGKLAKLTTGIRHFGPFPELRSMVQSYVRFILLNSMSSTKTSI